MDADEYYGKLDETLDLIGELQSALGDINRQITEVNKMAYGLGIEPKQLKVPSGDFMLTPLLQAKASVLLALAELS